ncbi:MAG TPA: hypothetical protein K8V15_11285 [Tessaracoccus flavescens]|uniref:Uncharacterized protein n=1 Tax=Tessaracoccus flavescens TaxID=399497 RepID=A0A921JRU1_9ACTN|nr:hypothetical protein [Tessaracoccus flavescens]
MTENTQPAADNREHAQAPAEGPDDQAHETQPAGKDERHHSEDLAEGTEDKVEQ